MRKFTNNKPYRDYAEYSSAQFPYKVQKISINAGLSCPNRDGSKGIGGCSYCNNQSFTPGYGTPSKTISQQLADGIRFFSHKYPEMKYLAYFQSYTNTYGEISSLIAKYEEALSHPDVVGLIISTRPDSIEVELLNYFESIAKITFLKIEYGVESTLDRTLKRINRHHCYKESVEAIIKTAERGIPVGAHMILGLPGESEEEILNHAFKLSELPLNSLKLHQLQIIKGTAMAKEYLLSPKSFRLYDLDQYIDLSISFVERLSPAIHIERFTSQSPPKMLIAPNWHQKNYVVREKIIKRFNERTTWQGRLYDSDKLLKHQ